MTREPKFEDLPSLIAGLNDKVDYIIGEFTKINKVENEKSKWMTVEDLRKYLPQHPSKATIYSWCSNKKIPFYKNNGKDNLFLQSEIDEWIISNSNKSIASIDQEVENYLNKKENESKRIIK